MAAACTSITIPDPRPELEEFVVERGWSEEQAIELGRRVLRGNIERIFNMG